MKKYIIIVDELTISKEMKEVINHILKKRPGLEEFTPQCLRN